MEFAVQIALPVLLVGVMISMGLELTVDDFRRVAEMPRPVLVGAFGQLVALPVVGLGFGIVLELPASLAIGVAVITACPGSAPSNAFSFLGRGNLPLSVSLTAVSSLVAAFAIPLWVGLAIRIHSAGETGMPGMPIGPAIGQLVAMTALPIAIGMWIRTRAPHFVARVQPFLRGVVVASLAVALVGLTYLARKEIALHLAVAGTAALALSLTALAMGYGAARLARLDARDSFTISIEVGLQNGALASLVVTNMLDRFEWVVFPGAYALVSLAPVCLWTWLSSRRLREPQLGQ